MHFSPPAEITAVYKITTPMFLGGADQQADSKVFRAASFKGALRFWWRALNWSRCFYDSGHNEVEALKILHRDEAALFGNATADNKGSQGIFNLVIETENIKLKEKGKDLLSEEKSYLLGMGLFEKRAVSRDRIVSGGEITVKLRFKLSKEKKEVSVEQQKQTLVEQQKQLTDALQALGYFGGLGARSRKGYGSLAIQSLKAIDAEIDVSSIDCLKEFIRKLDIDSPANAPLSAFTKGTRIDLSLKGKSSSELMGKLSDAMQLYRSYGLLKNGERMVNGKYALQKFKDDHDMVLNAIQGEPLKKLPERAIFGLPHNYFYSDGSKADITPKSPNIERRASPLLIHIHCFPNGEYIAIQTFLVGRFLPEGTEIEFKARKKQTLKNLEVDNQVIINYLNFEEYFNDKEVLLGE